MILASVSSRPLVWVSAYEPEPSPQSCREFPAVLQVAHSSYQVLISQPLAGRAVNEAVYPLRSMPLDIAFIETEGELIDITVHVLRADMVESAIILLRQEIASSDVTVQATLREHFLGETGHERGPAGTVRDLCRGTGRGDWACGSGRAIA